MERTCRLRGDVRDVELAETWRVVAELHPEARKQERENRDGRDGVAVDQGGLIVSWMS